MQIRVEDCVVGEGAYLSARAFRYCPPGLLCLAVRHPDELHLASEINARPVVIDRSAPKETEADLETVRRPSPRKREVIARFLQWLSDQGWQAPALIDAALRAIRDGRVVLVTYEELMRWYRAREASSGA
jgi:hypothetical protein